MTRGKFQIGAMVALAALIVALLGTASSWVWRGAVVSSDIKGLGAADIRIEARAVEADEKATLSLRNVAVVQQALTDQREDITFIRTWIEKQ